MPDQLDTEMLYSVENANDYYSSLTVDELKECINNRSSTLHKFIILRILQTKISNIEFIKFLHTI